MSCVRRPPPPPHVLARSRTPVGHGRAAAVWLVGCPPAHTAACRGSLTEIRECVWRKAPTVRSEVAGRTPSGQRHGHRTTRPGPVSGGGSGPRERVGNGRGRAPSLGRIGGLRHGVRTVTAVCSGLPAIRKTGKQPSRFRHRMWFHRHRPTWVHEVIRARAAPSHGSTQRAARTLIAVSTSPALWPTCARM